MTLARGVGARLILVCCIYGEGENRPVALDSLDEILHRLPVGDVGVVAGSARRAILAERIEVYVGALAGTSVDVSTSPRVRRDGFAEVGTFPPRRVRRTVHQCDKTFY